MVGPEDSERSREAGLSLVGMLQNTPNFAVLMKVLNDPPFAGSTKPHQKQTGIVALRLPPSAKGV